MFCARTLLEKLLHARNLCLDSHHADDHNVHSVNDLKQLAVR